MCHCLLGDITAYARQRYKYQHAPSDATPQTRATIVLAAHTESYRLHDFSFKKQRQTKKGGVH